MYDILSLFSVLYPHLSTTSVRQFSRVVLGLLAMTGQVSMLNISRWTSEGGSYRTVQRFFNTLIPWGTVYWVFFSTYLLDPKLWTIFSIFLRDAAYLFRTHSTPLECGRVNIPFSIDIALRWSAGGSIYRFLFSLRSNSTPYED